MRGCGRTKLVHSGNGRELDFAKNRIAKHLGKDIFDLC